MQKVIKTFNGADIVSFSQQSELIDAIINNMSNKGLASQEINDRNNIIRNGICYMLSMEWLRLIYANAHSWNNFCFHPRNSEGKIILNDSDIGYYTQIANNFYTYSKLFDDSTKATFQAFILGQEVNDCSYFKIDKQLVPLCFGKEITVKVKKAMEPQNDVNTLKGNLQNYFATHTDSKLLLGLRCRLNGRLCGHKTAIYCGQDGIYFYDPNFGIYKITDLDNFLDDLWTTYHIAFVKITEVQQKP